MRVGWCIVCVCCCACLMYKCKGWLHGCMVGWCRCKDNNKVVVCGSSVVGVGMVVMVGVIRLVVLVLVGWDRWEGGK